MCPCRHRRRRASSRRVTNFRRCCHARRTKMAGAGFRIRRVRRWLGLHHSISALSYSCWQGSASTS